MQYDVVVATLNRPDSLTRCLSHIESQTVLPVRVVIVDASDDHESIRTVVMNQRRSDIEWHFLKARERSSAHQRNQGLQLVGSDVVLMPDDDSMLYASAAAEIMAAYRADGSGVVAGVSGIAADRPPETLDTVTKSTVRSLKDKIEPLRNAIEDRFVAKPFASYPESLWTKREIPEWIDGEHFELVPTIGGYLLSLRSDVVCEQGFDETLGYGIGYALHEDMEISLRLQSAGYLLVAALHAPIFHDVHSSKRANGFSYGFCWIMNYIYACRRNIPSSSPAWSVDLPRFLRYKINLYRIRSTLRRDQYSRDAYAGAATAWTAGQALMSADLKGLSEHYKDLCDHYIRQGAGKVDG